MCKLLSSGLIREGKNGSNLFKVGYESSSLFLTLPRNQKPRRYSLKRSLLQEKLDLWLHGPLTTGAISKVEDMAKAPEECLTEMKVKDREKRTMAPLTSGKLSAILPCENYSSLKRLVRVMAYMQRFIHATKGDLVDKSGLTLTVEEL